MAFDRTNQADLDALHTEVYTDPTSMGYAGVPIEKSKNLVAFMNDPANNVAGVPTGIPFTREAVMLTWEPKSTLNEGLPWIEAMLASYDNISQYEDRYRNEYASPNSITRLDELQAVPSRPADLFGEGTVITEDDWYAARDNGGIV